MISNNFITSANELAGYRITRNVGIVRGIVVRSRSIVGTLGAKFTYEIAQTSSTSPDLEIPKWIVYLCIPLGSYLMCFRFLQVAWAFWWTGSLPHHDETRVEGVEIEAPLEGPAR